MKKNVVLSFACAILLACNNNGQPKSNNVALSAEEVYKQSIDKVAMVICYQDGIPYSQGSGFFIGKNTLITNFHVVYGSDKVELKIAEKEDIIKGAKVIKAAPEYDIAIIQTKQDFKALPIDSTSNYKIGSKVYAIGNPRGLEGTMSDGMLSGKRESEGIEYLQVTAPISPGNSGGPVLNDKGQVIGVSTFTFRNGQNLNFAMPIRYINKCTVYHPDSVTTHRGSQSDAITMSLYVKHYLEKEHYSLKNNTNDYVKNIVGMIIYKTMDDEVIDYRYINIDEPIAPKLSKRFTGNRFDEYLYYECGDAVVQERYKIEFRLLSYEIEE